MLLYDFLEYYDNWMGMVRINDNNLRPLAEGRVDDVVESYATLMEKKVVAFGFYENVLTVRIM